MDKIRGEERYDCTVTIIIMSGNEKHRNKQNEGKHSE